MVRLTRLLESDCLGLLEKLLAAESEARATKQELSDINAAKSDLNSKCVLWPNCLRISCDVITLNRLHSLHVEFDAQSRALSQHQQALQVEHDQHQAAVQALEKKLAETEDIARMATVRNQELVRLCHFDALLSASLTIAHGCFARA